MINTRVTFKVVLACLQVGLWLALPSASLASDPAAPVIDTINATGNVRGLRFEPYPAAAGYSILSGTNPAVALSDGAQSLYPDQFKALMEALAPVVRAVGRTL